MKSLLVLLAVSQLYVSTPARAEGELIALQAAIDVRDQFVTALEKKDFTAMTHQAMGNAVDLLAQDIRQNFSDEVMASKLETIWKQNQMVFFTVNLNELGDHAPLIPQLEDLLNQLAEKYGNVILTLPIVQDIRTLNFAIPVVFKPKGDWQSPEVDNRIEYRKHFIPFANIVTYYAALVACNYFAAKSEQPEMKKICKPAAEKLKFAMGRYIAPPMSDWIFKQTNKGYVVTNEARVYNTAEDLKIAIFQGSN
jgi:hypothetical protein